MLRIVKSAFLITALAALAWFAWQSRGLLADILRTARPSCLVAAVLLWTLMNVVAAVFTSKVFKSLGNAIPVPTAARIHIRNLPARYLPGGIWHTVGRAASFRNIGISAKNISIFVLLENVLAACIAFILGGLILAATRGDGYWSQLGLAAVFGAGIVLLLLPLLLSRIATASGSSPGITTLMSLAALTILSWCIAATVFVIYVSAFPELRAALAPLEIAGSYLFSWSVGFIAVFAPQGIGVFEVVAAELLRGTTPLMGVAALFAGFRLVILVADVVAWSTLPLWSGLAVGERRNLLGDQPDQEDDH